MRPWSSASTSGYSGDAPGSSSASNEGVETRDQQGNGPDPAETDALVSFLRKYGYEPDGLTSWKAGASDAPLLRLQVNGHEERDGHTWYQLECGLSSARIRPLLWKVSRRLMQLREELHDKVKTSLGSDYNEHFGATPFAHMGAPRGTTARLNGWCGTLATCISNMTLPPVLVAPLLQSLEAPAPPSLIGSTIGSASSSVASKIKERWSSTKESAKASFDQAQVSAAQTVQGASLSAAKANPQAAKAVSGAGFSFLQKNPTAAASAGGVGWKAMRQNPKLAFGAAKLAARANFSRS